MRERIKLFFCAVNWALGMLLGMDSTGHKLGPRAWLFTRCTDGWVQWRCCHSACEAFTARAGEDSVRAKENNNLHR